MANMSTHVQRSWNRLRESNRDTSLSSANAFREWVISDLPRVSKLLQAQLHEAQACPIWAYLLSSPIDQLPIRAAAWKEFASSLPPEPPTFNPVALWNWAQSRLWELLVFIDPDDACDNDEYDLELWWSASCQRAVFICGLGHHFEFRRLPHRVKCKALDPWDGETETLMPANQEIASKLYPDVEFLG